MKLYTREQWNTLPRRPRSVALGFFDGVHLGHRQVIRAAAREDAALCVYTFNTATFTAKGMPPLLCTDTEEAALLEAQGVEELLRDDFSAVCHLTPEEFVEQVLAQQLCAVQVTCGFNYRFGARGAGDATLLTELCAKQGIAVTVVPSVEVDGISVSSTILRRLIADGEVETAQRLLGRPFSLCQPVMEGNRIGRRLGLPTINQPLPEKGVHPRFGVYASLVEVDGVRYQGVTNVGVKPTVGADRPLAETYILDYQGDLYGSCPTVSLLTFLRPEQTFPNLEALSQQIREDIATAKARLETTHT